MLFLEPEVALSLAQAAGFEASMVYQDAQSRHALLRLAGSHGSRSHTGS